MVCGHEHTYGFGLIQFTWFVKWTTVNISEEMQNYANEYIYTYIYMYSSASPPQILCCIFMKMKGVVIQSPIRKTDYFYVKHILNVHVNIVLLYLRAK